MMCKRIIVALLLISLVSFPASSRVRIQQEDEQDQQQDLSVLPYDQYEGLQIVSILKEELEKGNDISPLIDKYFVSDFDERFAQEAAKTSWFPAKPSALVLADKKEVRRYYIALTNFTFLYMRLLGTLDRQHKEKLIVEGKNANEDEFDVQKQVPKKVLDAFRMNPFLLVLIIEDAKEKPVTSTDTAGQPDPSATSETEKESDTNEDTIRTIDQLNELSSAMEFAAGRMRNYLSTFPDDKIALDYIMPQDDESETAQLSYAVSGNAYITDEDEFYGVPKGTRLVCARILILHIDMVRIDGDLKVLSVYLPAAD